MTGEGPNDRRALRMLLALPFGSLCGRKYGAVFRPCNPTGFTFCMKAHFAWAIRVLGMAVEGWLFPIRNKLIGSMGESFSYFHDGRFDMDDNWNFYLLFSLLERGILFHSLQVNASVSVGCCFIMLGIS